MNIHNSPHDDFLDNAKFILIILVVFGHFLETTMDVSAAGNYLYRTLYLFHMPAFIFLAGITSKTTVSKPRVWGLFTIYIGLQIIYVALFSTFKPIYLIKPYWLLWFLISLICWRTLLPHFMKLRHPLAIALAISLISGMISFIGYPFSLSRTLVFLPFFIMGHMHGQRILTFCKSRFTIRHALILMIAVFDMYIFIDVVNSPRWQWGSFSYEAIKVGYAQGLFTRFIQIMTASVTLTAFLICIPNKQYTWTKKGANVLTIYLLHGFFILPLRDFLTGTAQHEANVTIFFSIILTALVVWLLSNDHLNRFIYGIYNGDMIRRLRRKADEQ